MGNKGYMVSPLALTERQLLIYKTLYNRCNFENMLVDMTIDQIRLNIKIVDLTEKVIYLDLKKMIDAGYIELIKKKSKGNAPIYRLIKYVEITGKLKVSQQEVKGKLKPSIFNSHNDMMGSNKEVKGRLKVGTIKEKEKEKEIYAQQCDALWKLYPKKKGKQDAYKKIPKILEKYGYEQLERCIERYRLEIEVNKKDMQYVKEGKTFFNSGYVDYLDENYQEQQITEKPEVKIGNLKIDYSKMTTEEMIALGTKK